MTKFFVVRETRKKRLIFGTSIWEWTLSLYNYPEQRFWEIGVLNRSKRVWTSKVNYNKIISSLLITLTRSSTRSFGSKELCCRLGARPQDTAHAWPRSTAPQSILLKGKTGVPGENPRSQSEIDKSLPKCGAQESNPGRRGGRREWPLDQPEVILYIYFLLGVIALAP